MRRFGYVAAGLAVALVVGCSGASEASPSGESSPAPELPPSASPLVTPSPSVAPSALEIPSASPSPIASSQPSTVAPTGAPPTEQPPTAPPPAGPGWELLAETPIGLPVVDPDEGAANIVGFEAGYISYTRVDLEIAFSADGVQWEQISLTPAEPRCEDEDLADEDFIGRAATNGRSAMLLAEYTTEDCELQTYAWLTDDGRSWQRSAPIGAPRPDSEAELVDLWVIPGGWEAAVNNGDDGTAVLHSADGVSWTQTATVSGFGSPDGAADGSGNRVLSVTAATSSFGTHSQERLVMSGDGLTWTDIEASFDRNGLVPAVSALEPPIAPGSEWLLFVDEFDMNASFGDWYRGQTLWVSDDLSLWEPISSPRASTSPLASTSEGLIAMSCNRSRERCAMYLTRDAREWTQITSAFPSDNVLWVAEGPAGVIAGTGEGAVYRLVP